MKLDFFFFQHYQKQERNPRRNNPLQLIYTRISNLCNRTNFPQNQYLQNYRTRFSRVYLATYNLSASCVSRKNSYSLEHPASVSLNPYVNALPLVHWITLTCLLLAPVRRLCTSALFPPKNHWQTSIAIIASWNKIIY